MTIDAALKVIDLNIDKLNESMQMAVRTLLQERTTYEEGFIAGLKWRKEQMLKEAVVNGKIVELGETYKDLTISVEGKELNEALQPLGAKEGDRVRMIITIKEDKK